MSSAFHGYAANGDVTGPLLYVNYGTLDDYQTLDALGINFTGAIVIVTYYYPLLIFIITGKIWEYLSSE